MRSTAGAAGAAGPGSMSASSPRRRMKPRQASALRRAGALVLLLALGTAGAALGDSAPTAREALEKARALERAGHAEEAVEYLSGLVDGEDAPLRDEAEVLLEAARLSRSPEKSRAYAARAIEHTRSSAVVEAARLLRGDSFFAEGLYLSAATEYGEAAKHSRERGTSVGDLKRAASLLAAGDAGAAADAYRRIAQSGATPGEATPRAQLGLARALLTAGRAAEAAEEFEVVARVYKDHGLRVQALAGTAECYEALGEARRAADALTALVTEYPNSYEAVLAREKLRRRALADTTSAAEADTAGAANSDPNGGESGGTPGE